MIDASLKLVSAQSYDVSAAFSAAGNQVIPSHSGASSVQFNLGRGGLPLGTQMAVRRTDTNTTLETHLVNLQYSTDDGTTWYNAGALALPAEQGPVFYTTPVGLVDMVPEQQDSSNIELRVVVSLQGTATSTSAADPTISVWLTAGERASNPTV